MKFRTLALAGLVLFSTAHIPAQARTHATAQSVIIDTDIGDDIDDAFAVALALRSPEFHIVGITTAYGYTTLRAHLLERLLAETHHSDIPLAVGIPTHSLTKFTQAKYAQGDMHPIPKTQAVDFLLAQAHRHPHQITLIAIGPLVNVGAAIDRDPAGFRLFRRVVLMGGSLRRGYDHGDPSKHAPPSPEWNIRNDIASARKLLNSGVPLYMLPLDSTQVSLPAKMLQQITHQSDALSQALAELVREAGKKPILYDPVTVAFAEDSALCQPVLKHIEVNEKGFTIETPGKPNTHVCYKSDEAAFLKLLEQKLSAH